MNDKDWLDQATENRYIKLIILIGAVYFGLYALSRIIGVLVDFYQAESPYIEGVNATLKSVGLLILAIIVIYLGIVLYSIIRKQKELEAYLEREILEPDLIEKKDLQRYANKQSFNKLKARLEYLTQAFRLISLKQYGGKKSVRLIKTRRHALVELLKEKGVKEEEAQEWAFELFPDRTD